MKQVLCEITGVAPLMLNNIVKANPLHPITKAIREFSKKRAKTEDDLLILSRLEWLGSLYPEKDGNFTVQGSDLNIEGFGYPIVHGTMIEACAIAGAKKHKNGMQFKAGVFCDEDPHIHFEGRRPIPEMYGDPQFVDTRNAKLQGKTTIFVTRAIIPDWKISFRLNYLPELVNPSDIRQALEAAGQQCALGTYRPRFGRFELTGFKEVS